MKVVGLLVVLSLLTGCVEEVRLFDVELRVRVADGVDPAVVLENDVPDDDDRLGLSFNYFPDVGDPDGGDPRSGTGLPFDPAATSARFELLAFLDGVPQARATSAVLPLPDDEGAVLSVPLLLSTVDVVGGLDPLPPEIGADACFSSDEQGRVFVVGGSTSNQSGYVLDDSFRVLALSELRFAGASRPGCVAAGGSVVVVGGCQAGALAEIHEIDADRDRRRVLVPAAEPCGAFAAKSLKDYWLFATNRVDLLSDEGEVKGSTAGVDVVDVEVLLGGNALVLDNKNSLFLYQRNDVETPIRLGEVQAIGRRFDDVVALSVDNQLLLVAGVALTPLRTVSPFAVAATSITVLSDDTLVAIVDGDLVVDPVEGEVVTLPLPRPRTHVSAILGDTVILAGGEGLDSVSVQAPSF